MLRSFPAVAAVAVVLVALTWDGGRAGPFSVHGATEAHAIRFFLGPDLADGVDHAELVSRLRGYVDVLNSIYTDTGRSFVLDPSTGVVVTPRAPMSGWCCPGGEALPERGFEVWVHAVGSPTDSHGGYMTVDESGAGVAAGFAWAQVWDAQALEAPSPQLEDFWCQIDHLAHEIAHIFGAGISEYYSLLRVDDTTGAAPRRDIDFNNPADPYWSDRRDFSGDVLLRNVYNDPALGSPIDLPSLVAAARFSRLSRTVISTGMRNPSTRAAHLPDLSRVRVVVRDAGSDEGVPGAPVTVWGVPTSPPYENEMLAAGTAGEGGMFEFDWGSQSPFNNVDHLRLVKAGADGYAAGASWVSVFDAQAASVVDGVDILVVDIALERRVEPASPSHPGLRLEANHPNPFNPSTTIRYAVARPAHVRITVFDAHGTPVAVLQDGPLAAGEHLVRWNGKSDGGTDASSGVYFCRIDAGTVTRVLKMVLVR